MYKSILVPVDLAEAELADQLEEIDPEAIHQALRGLQRSLAQQLQPLFETRYHAAAVTEAYAPSAEQAGRRALRRVCLSYLATLEAASLRQLVRRHFEVADNMTDQMAALAALNDSDWPERDACLDAFYTRWQHEALVVDKWFALQGVSRRADTPARLRLLLEHPAFSRRNPNRYRALVGSFAHQNLRHFHAADGSGYALLADEILLLDDSNPQVASRLTGAFNRWKKLEPGRRELARVQLERIQAKPGLSPDVFEVVSRNLA